MTKIQPATPGAALAAPGLKARRNAARRPPNRYSTAADPDSRLDARIEQSLVPLRIGNRWYTLVVCVDCTSRALLSYRLSPAPSVH